MKITSFLYYHIAGTDIEMEPEVEFELMDDGDGGAYAEDVWVIKRTADGVVFEMLPVTLDDFTLRQLDEAAQEHFEKYCHAGNTKNEDEHFRMPY